MVNKTSGYSGLSIPKEMADIIDKIIKDKKWGYRSRAEVVVDALRRLFRELGYFP